MTFGFLRVPTHELQIGFSWLVEEVLLLKRAQRELIADVAHLPVHIGVDARVLILVVLFTVVIISRHHELIVEFASLSRELTLHHALHQLGVIQKILVLLGLLLLKLVITMSLISVP